MSSSLSSISGSIDLAAGLGFDIEGEVDDDSDDDVDVDALLAGTLPSPPHGTSADIRPSPDVGESSIVEQPLLEEEKQAPKELEPPTAAASVDHADLAAEASREDEPGPKAPPSADEKGLCCLPEVIEPKPPLLENPAELPRLQEACQTARSEDQQSEQAAIAEDAHGPPMVDRESQHKTFLEPSSCLEEVEGCGKAEPKSDASQQQAKVAVVSQPEASAPDGRGAWCHGSLEIFGRLSEGLKCLDLSGFRLSSLEAFSKPGILPEGLLQLSVANNEFTDPSGLTATLSRLTGLTDLDLSGCKLRHLPPLDRQQRLEHFRASNNLLQSSKGLVLCTNLRSVLLAHNRLRRAEQLETLQKLEELDVSHNQLGPSACAALRTVAACAQLRVLRVVGNPFTEAKMSNHVHQLSHMLPSLEWIDNKRVRNRRPPMSMKHQAWEDRLRTSYGSSSRSHGGGPNPGQSSKATANRCASVGTIEARSSNASFAKKAAPKRSASSSAVKTTKEPLAPAKRDPVAKSPALAHAAGETTEAKLRSVRAEDHAGSKIAAHSTLAGNSKLAFSPPRRQVGKEGWSQPAHVADVSQSNALPAGHRQCGSPSPKARPNPFRTINRSAGEGAVPSAKAASPGSHKVQNGSGEYLRTLLEEKRVLMQEVGQRLKEVASAQIADDSYAERALSLAQADAGGVATGVSQESVKSTPLTLRSLAEANSKSSLASRNAPASSAGGDPTAESLQSLRSALVTCIEHKRTLLETLRSTSST